MNRILVLLVVVLIPISILTKKDDSKQVIYGNTLEEEKIEVVKEKEETKVLISNNLDKTDPFYIDLEDYVVGVVAGEMPASFSMEALKAQAVAARTYALYKMNINNYVLSVTISDQVYLTEEQMRSKWEDDFDYYYARVKEAVDLTKGEVITYNDELIISYYFAISNGYTDSALNVFNENRDYLVSVSSSWDKNYQVYSASRVMLRNNFCDKLDINCDSLLINNTLRGDNHYVKEITINGKTFTGMEIFNKLNLKSRDFEINVDGDNVIINTLGFGHGVGMSQYGAEAMASMGYNYQEILNYYYQNTKIEQF